MPDALILTDPNTLEDALYTAQSMQAGIILEPASDYHPQLHKQIRKCADIFGTRLYLPPEFADDAPTCRIITDCSPFGCSLADRLQTHYERWGARSAALIRPTAFAVTLPTAGAVHIDSLSQHELRTEQDIFFSEEAVCAYWVQVHSQQVSFYVFSTEHSIERQADLCRQFGIEPLVLASYGDK